MPKAKQQQTNNAFTKSRQRINRSLVIVLVCALGPPAVAGLYMSGHTSLPGSWTLTVLLSALVGLGGAWFMGRKLMTQLLDAIQNSVRAEAHLRKLMELSGDWYWQQNRTHEITRIVYRGKEHHSAHTMPHLPITGMARWDVQGMQLIDPRFSWESFKAHLDSHQPFDKVLFEYWPKGATRLVFESTGRPQFDGKGQFMGYFGVSTDLTAKHLNEHLLALQRALLQGVLLSAPIAELANAYAKGLRSCLSSHAEVVLGYRDKANSDTWRVRSTHSALHMPQDKGNAFWANPQAFCDPIEHEHKGLVWLGRMRPDAYFDPAWGSEHQFGTIWVALKKAIEPDQAEYWILIAQHGELPVNPDDALRIVTAVRLVGLCIERRVFEDDLQSLNSTLEQRIAARTLELTRSNAELEAFTYTVSHDLRAPLRAIDGFSTILQEDFAADLPDDARNLLQRISNNSRQMGGLIDGLLDFSRLLRTDVALIRLDLNHLLDQVLEQLDAKGKGVVHVVDLPVISADPVLIKQVWMNLVDNAIKFSSKVAQPRVDVQYRLMDGNHEFSVRDNGAGFDMKYAGKLFNVFERLHHKKDFDGTGVGLAIVKRIIERHGGQIQVQAQPGQGACFTFTLPAVQVPAEGSDK